MENVREAQLYGGSQRRRSAEGPGRNGRAEGGVGKPTPHSFCEQPFNAQSFGNVRGLTSSGREEDEVGLARSGKLERRMHFF